MKIALVQKEAFPLHGIMSLSAVLKKEGHSVRAYIGNEHSKSWLLKQLNKMDLVGFTAMVGDQRWIFEIASETSPPRILGGALATCYPEYCLQPDIFDFICVGEGEHAITELTSNLEESKRGNSLPKGIWTKYIRNGHAPLVDPSALPTPDRECYYEHYSFLSKITVKQFLTGRGCPFSCSYCVNQVYRHIYAVTVAEYVRRRDYANVVQEIAQVAEKYPLKVVSFTDDIFTLNKKWLDNFLKLYRMEVDLPFICNIRPETVDESTIKLLAEHGCYAVSMGIESGSPSIRRQILNRNHSNEQIIAVSRILKKFGIKLKTYNMIGIPSETVDNVWETIYLNQSVKPDHTSVSFLQPYPKYEITEQAKASGLIPENYSVDDAGESIYIPSKIVMDSRNEIINLQTFFYLAVKYPHLERLIRWLSKLPSNSLFRLLAKLHYGLYMGRIHSLTISDMIRLAVHTNPFKI